jgi:protein phosphatase
MSFTLKYQLANPVFLLEQGKRPYLEDAIYPAANDASPESRIFMVCDGVGGSTRGDEASRLTCTFFPSLILENLEQLNASDYSYKDHYELLSKRLIKLEDRMDEHVHQHPEFRGMATTLTYLHLSPYGVVVAWAGDSRIYQISKNGERKFRTEDHSLVNELVKRGEISEEEAAHHPRKNVILRAVSGAGNPTKLDLQIRSNDLEDGDYFLACTDGIIDGIEDAELCKVVGDPTLSLDEKRNFIREKCAIHSRDNFAMYLIQIEKVEKTPITEIAPHSGTTATGSTVIHNTSTQMLDAGIPVFDDSPVVDLKKDKKATKKFTFKWLIWLIIVLVAAALIYNIVTLLDLNGEAPPISPQKTTDEVSSPDPDSNSLQRIIFGSSSIRIVNKTKIKIEGKTDDKIKYIISAKNSPIVASHDTMQVTPYKLGDFIVFVGPTNQNVPKQFIIYLAENPTVVDTFNGTQILPAKVNYGFKIDRSTYVFDKESKKIIEKN